MSNAMSRSKSRWRGALLATVATAAVLPIAAKAQTGMTVGITTNPLGSGPQSSVYIDPYSTDKLYVYATVTGTAAPSASYVDGLEYLYFNVNAVATGPAGATGSITAATPSTLFGGNSFNQSNGAPGAGAQGGAMSPITSSPSIVLGSSTLLGSMAKPRSAGNVFKADTSNSGSNIIVNGNSVSFLVETLTYTPTTSAVLATPSTPAAVNKVAFNVSTPSASLVFPTTSYYGANYFVGLPSNPGLTPVGSASTLSNYTASASGVSLANALPGDANLDGTVNFSDFGTLLQNYNLHVTTGFRGADFNNDGVVNFTDFGFLLQNYNLTLGGAPAGLTGPAALLAADPTAVAALEASGGSSVPEPASAGILAVSLAFGSLRRGRRRHS